MSYVSGGTVLGADAWPPAWIDHMTDGRTYTVAANGDIVINNADGTFDSSIPHPGSGSYDDVDKDPNSMWYGKTAKQQAEYFEEQGVDVAPTAGALDNMTPKERAAAIAANAADLHAAAANDAFVQLQLKNLNQHIIQGVNDPDTLARTALRVTADKARQDAYNAAEIAWYAAGHKGPFPGVMPGDTTTGDTIPASSSPAGGAVLPVVRPGGPSAVVNYPAPVTTAAPSDRAQLALVADPDPAPAPSTSTRKALLIGGGIAAGVGILALVTSNSRTRRR